MFKRLAIMLLTLLVCEQYAFSETVSVARPTVKKAVSERFDTAPFDNEHGPIPKGYKGADPYALAAAMAKVPLKGEFESTAKFEARLSEWASAPLVGSIKLKDKFAIRALFVSLEKSYDADSETMKFSFDATRQVSAEDSATPFLIVDSQRKNLPSVVGQTGLGVKFRYERSAFNEFGVKFTNLSHTHSLYEFKVEPNLAKDNVLWAVLFIGSVSTPYIFAEESYHTPSLTERYEQYVKSRGIVVDVSQILVYDLVGGQVIGRIAVR